MSVSRIRGFSKSETRELAERERVALRLGQPSEWEETSATAFTVFVAVAAVAAVIFLILRM